MPPHGGASSSQSASQTHDTSRPSAMRSLRMPNRSSPSPSSASVRSTSLAPAGFLTSRMDVGAPADLDRLGAAEGGRDGLEPADHDAQRHAEREAQGGGADGVVDVVEAGQRQLDARGPGGRVEREGGGADAAQLDVPRDHRRLGAARAAVRAVVVAEVREIRRVVDVGMAAAAAVLGVGGVLELGMGEPVVVHPEEEHPGCGRSTAVGRAAEVGDQRVVGVEDERAAAAAGAHHGRPAVGDGLQLAVAVELVAEQVAEQQRARGELLDDRPEPELVHLEQPDVAGHGAPAAARGHRERGGHAAGHVRPRAVVDEAGARAVEHGRDHGGRRRLAVGGADHRAALRAGARPACRWRAAPAG